MTHFRDPVIGVKRIIDTVWTIRGVIDQKGRATISSFSRNDPEGYDHEYRLPIAKFQEDENRIALAVLVKERDPDGPRTSWYAGFGKGEETFRHPIANPAHVFSYGEPKHEE